MLSLHTNYQFGSYQLERGKGDRLLCLGYAGAAAWAQCRFEATRLCQPVNPRKRTEGGLPVHASAEGREFLFKEGFFEPLGPVCGHVHGGRIDKRRVAQTRPRPFLGVRG